MNAITLKRYLPEPKLDGKLFVREEWINAESINFNHISCQRCGNDKALIISGYQMTPREETYEDGRLKDVHNFVEATSYDIKQIYCLECQTKLLVHDPVHFMLHESNLKLNKRIQELSGDDPLNTGPVH
jgi:hypothetical protein